jgi:exodeoxyribonuclease V alpha subunit
VAIREPVVGAVVEATLARITFATAQTGYTVARVDPGQGGELVTVVGSLLGAQPGETLRPRGRWGAHPQLTVGAWRRVTVA